MLNKYLIFDFKAKVKKLIRLAGIDHLNENLKQFFFHKKSIILAQALWLSLVLTLSQFITTVAKEQF